MKVNYKKLIIGTGFIAQNFKKYSNYLRKNNMIVYAAGISKSTEENTANLKKRSEDLKSFVNSMIKELSTLAPTQ